MKELLQRQEREKSTSTPSTPTQTTTQSIATTAGTTQSVAVTQFPTGSTITKPILIGAGLPAASTTPSSQPSASHSQAAHSNTTITTSGGSSSTNQAGAAISAGGGIVLQPALITQLSNQLPKNVQDQIAKLPPDQQKMVYLHHFKRLQMLRQQLQSKQKASTITSSVSSEQILRAQERLVKEQQVPLTVSGRTPPSKTSFSSLKLVTSNAGTTSLAGLSPFKGKKSKGKGKDHSVDANE